MIIKIIKIFWHFLKFYLANIDHKQTHVLKFDYYWSQKTSKKKIPYNNNGLKIKK